METVQWLPKYNTGNETIDKQHRQIVKIIKKLQELQGVCLDSEQTDKLFDELQEYAQTHFSYEEKLFEQYGFPFLNSHRRDHETFTKMLAQWRNDEEIDCKSKKVSEFLVEWLFEHILHNDIKLKDCISTQTSLS